ncbi:transglycosylase SLT domain-containing protein [Marinimicrobium sp. UBA4509]|jgi:soluble lytic murein transglycosylase-like protein|uniref:transglycosylase SLT domain-containing protein n=1 Tax=Marinimicrobium sp. UBA4509 TaxID=1946811 RepID=UPI002580A152|nr:transglycosylase SLT domain-containing protein [Marinimicrobium sp. UBA4509]
MVTVKRIDHSRRSPAWILPAVTTLLAVFALALVQCAPASASKIPAAAERHRATLVRAAHWGFGLDAPISTLAAQVHQESRWQTAAKSPVGAAGLAQFMPATAEWIPDVDRSLANPDPYNPGWALRAMVVYDRWLMEQVDKRIQAEGPCESWAMVLSAYNGGLAWVYRDRQRALASGASGLAWFDEIEHHNAGRSAANFRENRHYVRVVLLEFEPLYHRRGWGPGVCVRSRF